MVVLRERVQPDDIANFSLFFELLYRINGPPCVSGAATGLSTTYSSLRAFPFVFAPSPLRFDLAGRSLRFHFPALLAPPCAGRKLLAPTTS